MSKILVIENQKEFRKRLNVATIDSVCVVADVMGLLKDYEEDVIEVEGYVSSHIDHAKSTTGQDIRIHGSCILLDACFKPGDPIQVLVLKPKKPEVKE